MTDQPDPIEPATEAIMELLDPDARREMNYHDDEVGNGNYIYDRLVEHFAPALQALKAMELLYERKWSIILVHHSGAWSVLDTCCKFLGESDDPTSAVLKAAGEESDGD